ncbi:MAG: LysM peptidoglycan-binding domain-containing protein, partial [Deltaproteobacteria bacterium]|nr:LysM peptidoglycan-binding domain-containing protein [Deltaproteobacteria bacterium]
EENRQYLPRFLAACKIMRNLEALGFAAIHSANARQVSEIHVRPGTDLMSLSRRIGMSWDEFSAYNPAYLRCISPPDRSTRVFVPPHLAAEAAAFARKPDKEDAGWIKHTIRQGDTFANISGRTGVPVAELRRVNQIGEFRAGKVLRIPRSNPLRPMPSRIAANTGAAGAAPAQTGPSTGREYTVQPGDTVYGLARSWNVTTEAVMRTNNLSGSALSIGQKLVIPGAAAAGIPAAGSARTVPKPSDKARAVTYTVRAGDTVWAIARKFDVDPAELMRANNLTRNSTIRPGDVMRMIPN